MGKKLNLEAMTIDDMWHLHEEISRVLSIRLTLEKRELENRLGQLHRESQMTDTQPSDGLVTINVARRRRLYPRVFPKYRNPNQPTETWSGRGKQPKWLAAALMTGHSIDEFAISKADSEK